MAHKLIAGAAAFLFVLSVWTVKAAEPSFELTARYISGDFPRIAPHLSLVPGA